MLIKKIQHSIEFDLLEYEGLESFIDQTMVSHLAALHRPQGFVHHLLEIPSIMRIVDHQNRDGFSIWWLMSYPFPNYFTQKNQIDRYIRDH
ncbi:hypothetical protein AVEN_74586-1 [Araneus ventricosus]|uniref:Uncharacterized protein n=1 Tax=Araneus ventricosus TaxID=182803 RepID=A0A4Y2MEY9_ARAVE|nr:hypothetical protein AVEN_74586-1 [Araneus ventricosus]